MQVFREQSPTYQIGLTEMLSKKVLQQILKNSGFNITPEQLGVLNILLEKDNISMQEISMKFNRDNSATTRLIDNLEKKSFVERTFSKFDRRLKLIILTNLGKETVLKANIIAKKYVFSIVGNIEKKDLDIFINVIKKIQKNILIHQTNLKS